MSDNLRERLLIECNGVICLAKKDLKHAGWILVGVLVTF